MLEENKETITINDVEYNPEEFTYKQKSIFNHLTDIDQKVNTVQFNLDQLIFCKDAFLKELLSSLTEDENK